MDTCIITKYDLSEREKSIKDNFFKKKELKEERKEPKQEKFLPKFLYNEENLEKLVKDNFPKEINNRIESSYNQNQGK